MNKLTVLFFTAPWCGPCKLVNTRLQEVANEIDCSLIVIDIEDKPDLAKAYHVDHLPTVIWVKDEKELNRQVGAITRSQMRFAGHAALVTDAPAHSLSS